MDTKASIKNIRFSKASGDIQAIATELSEIAGFISQSEQKQMLPMEGLHQILKERRKELGLSSQEEAAALSSVGLVTYRKAEESRGNPTLKTLKAIAEGLNLKLWIEKC